VENLSPIKGDVNLIKQVWINLISNAVKFSSTRKKAEIIIGCQEKNGSCVYYIRDNGVGFDMKYVDKLFGVFQRLHTREAFEGTGIGLATVQRIVHRHGGRVWAEGEVDNGATFYFSLSKPEESDL
jgi:two-component system, sensor histidine kinase and response regulator